MQQLLTRDEEISAKQHEISVREHELVAVRAEVSELVMALANARDALEEETSNGRRRFSSAVVLWCSSATNLRFCSTFERVCSTVPLI
jgi:hypothetical protein